MSTIEVGIAGKPMGRPRTRAASRRVDASASRAAGAQVLLCYPYDPDIAENHGLWPEYAAYHREQSEDKKRRAEDARENIKVRVELMESGVTKASAATIARLKRRVKGKQDVGSKSITITKGDLDKAADGEFLNDSIVDFYLQ